MEKQKNIEGGIFLVLFCLTIPLANWMIGHVGDGLRGQRPVPAAGRAQPHGAVRRLDDRHCSGAARPCAAPLGRRIRHCRDRRRRGDFRLALRRPRWCSPRPRRFCLSEFADFAVYTPLARRRLVLAVLASSLLGLVVNSIVFLWLAFGSLDFLAGQIVGKLWMVLLAMPFVAYLRRRDERLGLKPA